jgi:hypothetical protein
MIVLIIFNKYRYYLDIIKNYKIIISIYATIRQFTLILHSRWLTSHEILWSDEIWQTCPLVSGVGITG